MRLTKTVPDKDLLKKGIEILFRELGKVDAIRFLTIPREKRVESVKRHRDWQQTLDKDTLFDEIFGDKKQSFLKHIACNSSRLRRSDPIMTKYPGPTPIKRDENR